MGPRQKYAVIYITYQDMLLVFSHIFSSQPNKQIQRFAVYWVAQPKKLMQTVVINL